MLRRIDRHGAQTVPALARAKAPRRQSVQPVVDALANDGLVERVANPAHTRSPRLALTPRGADLVARMDRIDARVLGAVSAGIPASSLSVTAATLSALRTRFESERRWRPALDHDGH